MGDVRTEPSMEEILASIKRIIADDGLALNRARPRADPPEAGDGDAVLELTETVAPPSLPAPPLPAPPPPAALPAPAAEAPPAPTAAAPAAPPVAAQPMAEPAVTAPPSSLVSEDAAVASRHALSTLSSMVLRTPGTDNTLDGLMRELLRPMLKEWLDARLPDLVESLVSREIARITGKAL